MLSLCVVSLLGEIYEGNAARVDVPGALAPFSILEGHAPLISQLSPGIFSIYSEEDDIHFVPEGGFLEVKNNIVTALLEKAIYPEEIDLKAEQKKLKELSGRLAQDHSALKIKEKTLETIQARIRLAHFIKNKKG